MARNILQLKIGASEPLSIVHCSLSIDSQGSFGRRSY